MDRPPKSALFSEYEDKLDEAAAAFQIDPSNKGAITDLLALLEHYLCIAVPSDYKLEMEIYREARYWLGDERCRDQVWEWTLRIAREAIVDQRSRMCVALFEYLTLPNTGIEFLTMIFDTWGDNRLKWILPEIYRHKPRHLFRDMMTVSSAVDESQK